MRKIVLLVALTLCAFAVAPAVAGAAKVAVYDDPSFVDTTDPDPGQAESDNVQASLDSFGHDVKTFGGTGSGAFSRGLSNGQRLLVIPELEKLDVTPDLSQRAIRTIRTYVRTGGGLIVFSDEDVNLLNTVFGYSLTNIAEGATGTKTAAAAGTAFGGGPATVPTLSATDVLNTASLPVGASAIYATGAEAWVVLFPFGSGEIVYIAWDWFDAQPLGADDGGWLDVLRRAVTEVAGCTVSGTAGSDSLAGTPGADRICAFGGGDGISGRGGRDVILAGSGNDIAAGGGGNDSIIAGTGHDIARGQDGTDFLNVRDGVHGNDSAFGGAGNDTCRRDSGDNLSSC